MQKDGYVDAERFAEAYALDHVRLKGWSPGKVAAALRFEHAMEEGAVDRALAQVTAEEVLDAAHGHVHAGNGDELTEEQRKEDAEEDDHAPRVGKGGAVNKFLMVACVILIALLLLSGIRQFNLERKLANLT